MSIGKLNYCTSCNGSLPACETHKMRDFFLFHPNGVKYDSQWATPLDKENDGFMQVLKGRSNVSVSRGGCPWLNYLTPSGSRFLNLKTAVEICNPQARSLCYPSQQRFSGGTGILAGVSPGKTSCSSVAPIVFDRTNPSNRGHRGEHGWCLSESG